jgi:hypothetical protein
MRFERALTFSIRCASELSLRTRLMLFGCGLRDEGSRVRVEGFRV